MKYLTLEYIKEHSRILGNAQNDYLERTGNAAEQAILNLCQRTIEDIYAEYGEVPPDLIHVTLELAEHLYNHRGPTEQVAISAVPYNFDLLVKPYMRLTSGSRENITDTTLGSDVKIIFGVCLPNDMVLADVDFTGMVYNTRDRDSKIEFGKSDCHPIGDGARYCFMFNSDELGVGRYMLRLTVHVPDSDYPAGYSKEVVVIDPKINVIG